MFSKSNIINEDNKSLPEDLNPKQELTHIDEWRHISHKAKLSYEPAK